VRGLREVANNLSEILEIPLILDALYLVNAEVIALTGLHALLSGTELLIVYLLAAYFFDGSKLLRRAAKKSNVDLSLALRSTSGVSYRRE